MSVTTFFGAFAPAPKKVRLRIFRYISRDVRAPITFAQQFEANKRAFKARRQRECRKVPVEFNLSIGE